MNILSEKYPQIQVRGANFDPSGLYLYLSKGVFIVKLLLIVAIISQFDIFAYMNVAPTPAWWNLIIGNKMYACMMVFFVGNMLEQTVGVLYLKVVIFSSNTHSLHISVDLIGSLRDIPE